MTMWTTKLKTNVLPDLLTIPISQWSTPSPAPSRSLRILLFLQTPSRLDMLLSLSPDPRSWLGGAGQRRMWTALRPRSLRIRLDEGGSFFQSPQQQPPMKTAALAEGIWHRKRKLVWMTLETWVFHDISSVNQPVFARECYHHSQVTVVGNKINEQFYI